MFARVALLLIVLLVSVPSAAQSASDFEQKYGKPKSQTETSAQYEVRPGILINATFTSRGDICEALIEPTPAPGAPAERKGYITLAQSRAIVDEVIPESLRGRETFRIRMGNYTSLESTDCDNVRIITTLVGVGGSEDKLKIDSVRVRWKLRSCRAF